MRDPSTSISSADNFAMQSINNPLRMPQSSTTRELHLRTIRLCLLIVIVGLVFSGATAFALQTELTWLLRLIQVDAMRPLAETTHLLPWIQRVAEAVTATNRDFPFLAYGTDWLAFAHIVIAIAFIGPLRDPVRNKWIITFGLIACAGVLPLALIAGQVRGIPLAWRMIDCSFGIVAAIPLLLCEYHLRALAPCKRKSPLSIRLSSFNQQLVNDAHDWLH
jgi:hypothetical protein